MFLLSVLTTLNVLIENYSKGVRYWGVNEVFRAAPSYDVETLGQLNASISLIPRNIRGAIATTAPPVPPPLKCISQSQSQEISLSNFTFFCTFF